MRVKSNSIYKVFVWTPLSAGLLALVLARTSTSAADAQAALCSNLTTFQQSVEELTQLDSYSTLGELKAATSIVRHTFGAVQQSNSEVRNNQVDALETAYQDLGNVITDLPDDISIQDAANNLQPQIAAVQSARQQVTSGVECP
jgi:hypothetical protein